MVEVGEFDGRLVRPHPAGWRALLELAPGRHAQRGARPNTSGRVWTKSKTDVAIANGVLSIRQSIRIATSNVCIRPKLTLPYSHRIRSDHRVLPAKLGDVVARVHV